MAVFLCVTLSWAAVLALLIAEYRGSRAGVWIAKPLASTGFLATALAAGALASDYGNWLLIGLALCWVGDVLLIPHSSKASFRAGVLVFLLGHLAYAVAFAERGLSAPAAGIATVVLGVPALWVLRWLRPHVGADLSVPIYAYVAVITAMLVFAVSTVVAQGTASILVGASMFYLSDLAVARQRFVAQSFTNKAWGLPLYFGGQLVLALSAGAS